MGRPSAAARNASAYRSARSVIGLYGDQGVSWSILLEADLSTALDRQLAAKRLADLVASHPRLGSAPQPVHVGAGDWTATRSAFADRPYTESEPLLRLAVLDDADTARVLIAAHHGAADGLGLLALLGAVLDEPVCSSARGIVDRPRGRSFLRSATRRLGEALFTPPSRVAADRGGAPNASFGASSATNDALGAADQLRAADQQRAADQLRAAELGAGPQRLDTATLVVCGARAVAGYNAARGVPARRVVAAVGASKAGGSNPTPGHDSTFLRLRVDPQASADEVREQLRGQPPEPDFPTSTSPLASTAARMLAPRLGSTFLASNLGLITAQSVAAVRFYPAASGPNGLSFGMASTPSSGSVTVRARGAFFSAAAAQELLDRFVDARRSG